MALSPELQAQVDMQIAVEQARSELQEAGHGKARKMEAIRLAKEILIENRRTKAVADAADISDEQVTTYAASIVSYIES